MVLETIYVVRHGYRLNWVVEASTGLYSTTTPTPTGIPSDPQLASYGVAQAEQLAHRVATLDPAPEIVYSSPFYRCLETIKPTVRNLRGQGKASGKVRIENGISEFFGTARFTHPAPASIEQLSKHFDFIDRDYLPSIRPSANGESLDMLHNRHAYALHRLIESLDKDASQPRSILLCTHAASMICVGRVLTGQMPIDVGDEDFRCGTCALSRFDRRKPTADLVVAEDVAPWQGETPEVIPVVDWRGGKGIGGGWDCLINGDCSHLTGGEERKWHFTGDESFIDRDVDSTGITSPSEARPPTVSTRKGTKL